MASTIAFLTGIRPPIKETDMERDIPNKSPKFLFVTSLSRIRVTSLINTPFCDIVLW